MLCVSLQLDRLLILALSEYLHDYGPDDH